MDLQRAKVSLEHVLWISGSTTAGKSTIAKRLARDHGFRHYSADEHRGEQRARATKEAYPAIHAFRTDPEFLARVMRQPADRIREIVRDVWSEFFEMAVCDLLTMPKDGIVVVDVFCNEAIAELRQVTDPERLIFLVPTKAFQAAEYRRRFGPGGDHSGVAALRDALEGCPDPEATFMSGWVQYQQTINQYSRDECEKHSLPLLETGGSASPEECYEAVSQHFRLPASG